MIYVSEAQLSEVEYLLGQATLGNHVLFDTTSIRAILTTEPEAGWSTEQAYSAEPYLERLITLPSLAEKKSFLESLDAATYENVVRTYFNIVENNIYQNLEVTH